MLTLNPHIHQKSQKISNYYINDQTLLRIIKLLYKRTIVQGIVIIAIGDDAIALEHRWLKRSDYYLDPTFCFFNSTSKHDDTCVLGYYQQIEIDTQVGANDSLSEISSLLVHTLAKQRATA
ncbi:hypothetical protein [Shewanella sp. SM95]|uniref:hypothetical protein n=1 Tax=Shewanella sp. SM95 TaxID=2912812 RepID=UPI0021DAD86B|nr:hypothetical protein [Shewanella sp. SM95]MCU8000786.1 hypothetical protein [Shewanella sp. SM95]